MIISYVEKQLGISVNSVHLKVGKVNSLCIGCGCGGHWVIFEFTTMCKISKAPEGKKKMLTNTLHVVKSRTPAFADRPETSIVAPIWSYRFPACEVRNTSIVAHLSSGAL